MQPPEGASTFNASPEMYSRFMGRYSVPLAHRFVEELPLRATDHVLDIGCGPGALTGALVAKVGTASVSAIDPSPPFVANCQAANPGIDVRQGRAEDLPYPDGSFDAVLSQLVLFFISDLDAAGSEMLRVAKPGGLIAANTWDVSRMEMMSVFWRAAGKVTGVPQGDPPPNRFANAGELTAYFSKLGLVEIEESTIEVDSSFDSLDDLWFGYEQGIGPIGAWCVSQPEDTRARIEDQLFHDLGEPTGSITLTALARTAHGRTPA